MCTVVFIPVKDRYYFASLRDENPIRERSSLPLYSCSNGQGFLAPIDPAGGGTWVGVNNSGTIIILLNGGFENHLRKESYAKSRGTIVTELLAAGQPLIDWESLCLNMIEPFTLIVWEEYELFQLVWDGVNKHHFQLSNSVAHIWSSATLYEKDARELRKTRFQAWIDGNPVISKLSMANFFKTYEDPVNGFFMNRSEKIKTLSYSFIEVTPFANAEFSYYDLFNQSRSIERIPFTVDVNQAFRMSNTQ